jgi:hypothetical protein
VNGRPGLDRTGDQGTPSFASEAVPPHRDLAVQDEGTAGIREQCPVAGTPEENKKTADGTITYFGTHSLSEADSSIAIHVEGSSFPNWNSTDQKRLVAITGDQLTLMVRPPGGDVVDVIWKRAK